MADALEITQGSPEWHVLRIGKITASRIADMLARTKSGYGAGRANLMADLICETLTGRPTETFTNAAMARGTEKEPDARAAYEFYSDVTVEQIAFVAHPTIDLAGCSPDGLVGADGLVEIKNPNSATHIETLLTGTIADKYVKQMQFQMACTGRQWCDFVSHDDRLPETMRLFIKRVERDDRMIAEIETEARAFLTEMNGKLAQLRARYELEKAAA